MATIGGSNIVTDGLVLSLDAANRRSYPSSGTTWSDLSENGNDGTLTNGPTFSSENGGILTLDGSDDRVALGDRPLLRPSTITHCAWVRAHSFVNWHGIISNMSSWGTGFSMQIGVTQRIALMISGQYLTTSYTPLLNTWYFICGTHDASNNNILYVNGKVENSVSREISYNANAVTEIGVFYTGGGLPLDGDIATVMTYNRALSAIEILQNYNSTKARFNL